MMTQHLNELLQSVSQQVIAIELLAILLIILMAYILKIYYTIRNKLKLIKSNNIERFFVTLINQNADYSPSGFKRSWKNIELIVPVLNKLTALYHGPAWKKILTPFCQQTLLPLARKKVSSVHWAMRFYAAESFSFCSEEKDDDIIFKLLNDPTLIVFYSTLRCAIRTHSERSIETILKRMSHENWITKSLFLQAFKDAPTKIPLIIENKLMQLQDPLTRSTCYNILLTFSGGKIRWNITEDLNSKNLNLKLSALKYLAHANNKVDAVPTLITFLSDPQWEVRTVSLRLLSELAATEAVSSITPCLHDPNWWVRLAAAQTLKTFGEEGKKILESEEVKMDPEAYRVAQHVLNRL